MPEKVTEKMNQFNPHTYWQKRGANYPATTKKESRMESLAAWISKYKPDSILEVGSGWGRVYAYLKAQETTASYTMVDFVDSMRQGCQDATGILPDEWDGVTLPYDDKSFDLVLSVDVLLHVPPADIGRVFAEHVRVSRQWLYIRTIGLMYTKIKTEHCFWHDYLKLFGENKLRVLNAQFYPRGRGMGAHWVLQK